MTVAATDEEGPFDHITDLIGWNKYYGWYYGKYMDFVTFFDDWHKKYPEAKIGVSEYGAGASILQHADNAVLSDLPFSYVSNDNKHKNPVGHWHPEEWQTELHMEHIRFIAERDYIWGSFIWNMFDFGSSIRNEGDRPGINDKGLVTYDRKTKKDAFFLYKANWNKEEPVVHLCSKRYTEPRELNTADIIAFTNQPDVQLFVNESKIGKKMKADNYATIIWKGVQLRKGENKIEVKSGLYSDICVWSVR
jgi:beta-galactosidase